MVVRHIKGSINNQWLVFVLRLILGAIFIAASIGKLSHQVEFVNTVTSYNILPGDLAQFYGFVLPWVELIIGCFLILGLFSRFASATSILLVVSFITANAYSLFHPVESSCHCFGQIALMRHPGALLLDTVMLLMALPILLHETRFFSLGAWLSGSNSGLQKRKGFVFGKVSEFAMIVFAILLITSILVPVVAPANVNAQCPNCKVDSPKTAPPQDMPRLTPLVSSTSENVKSFRTDTAPELDWYQPCDGGDNLIDFNINVHDVDITAIKSAKLTLAVWDVDYECGWECCERDEVYFNGYRLTTPVPYLTGANGQWSTVTFNVDPQWVSNGNNYVAINIDTLGCDAWCVECDWGELALSLGRPEIEDIEISPKNPETTKDVTFTAKLKNMDGYEVVKIAWSGDVQSGEGNPFYTVKPAAGTHGENKHITAMLTYRNIATNETGTTSYSKKFDLFFDKDGKDGFLGFLGPDNWFKYWSTDRDGACSYGSLQPVFSYIYGGGPYTPYGLRGSTLSGTGVIWVYNAATTTSQSPPFPYSHNGLVVDGSAYQGIDHVEFILEHERTHNRVAWNWLPFIGAWWGKKDSDNDRIPDDVEDTLPGFNKNDPKSFPGYPVSGGTDEEVYCDYMAVMSNPKGDASKDWASPGKQTNPPGYMPCYVNPGATGNDAKIGVSFTDAGEDTNGDGKFDYLVVRVPIDVVQAGSYWAQGTLQVTDQIVLTESGIFDLAEGPNVVELRFDGGVLRQARVDGPYTIKFVNLGGQSYLDTRGNAHTTFSYAYTDFEPLDLEFQEPISDRGIDADADGKYDALSVLVPTTGYSDGEGQVEGWLFDETGTELSYAKADIAVSTGESTNVELLFNGIDIRQKREDGPYHLRYLMSEVEGAQQDALYEAYATGPYSWSEFQSTGDEFQGSSSFSDFGVDLDGNGLFDILRIEMAVDIAQAGPHTVLGRLFDSDGEWIDDVILQETFSEGQQTFALDFTGARIWEHHKAGPYRLKYVFMYDETGSLMDSLPNAYSTLDYQYTQFENSGIALTGNYSDHGTDVDSNGLYDYLTVDVELIAANDGYYALNARLMDENENEIAWAANSSWLSADQPQILQLNFDGLSINKHGANGPYYLRDVYVYNMGNATQSDYAYDAYTTATYNYRDFETILSTDLANVKLLCADATVTGINVFSFDPSAIDLTYKPESVKLEYAYTYLIDATGSGNFTLEFTDVLFANAVVAYKIDPTSDPPNQWVELYMTS